MIGLNRLYYWKQRHDPNCVVLIKIYDKLEIFGTKINTKNPYIYKFWYKYNNEKIFVHAG